MLTISQMKQIKELYGFSYAWLSKETEIPLPTLQRILSGTTKNPHQDTLQALSRVLTQYAPDTAEKMLLAETPEPFSPVPEEKKKAWFQGNLALKKEDLELLTDWDPSRKPSFRYTIGDYYALPDDLRVELIDGDFYLMEAPSTVHQGIIAELTFLFQLFVRQKQGTCRVFMSPLDVRLLYGQPTILQPDILIICDPAKTKLRGIFGAPDLVIEILSKNSRRKDMGLKLSKYMEAKVKEYWMIDPLQRKVFVYQPEKEEFCTLYSFDEAIPVGIWNGECRINMKEVWERVEGLNQD